MIMKRSYYAIESKTIGHIKLLMNYHILITQYSTLVFSHPLTFITINVRHKHCFLIIISWITIIHTGDKDTFFNFLYGFCHIFILV